MSAKEFPVKGSYLDVEYVHEVDEDYKRCATCGDDFEVGDLVCWEPFEPTKPSMVVQCHAGCTVRSNYFRIRYPEVTRREEATEAALRQMLDRYLAAVNANSLAIPGFVEAAVQAQTALAAGSVS